MNRFYFISDTRLTHSRNFVQTSVYFNHVNGFRVEHEHTVEIMRRNKKFNPLIPPEPSCELFYVFDF